MGKVEREQKRPRERDANWSPAEKEHLRKYVNMHIDIVEHKGNDAYIVAKKKNSWKAIRERMVSAGFDREVSKLKAQWVRMKISAKKGRHCVNNLEGDENPIAIEFPYREYSQTDSEYNSSSTTRKECFIDAEDDDKKQSLPTIELATKRPVKTSKRLSHSKLQRRVILERQRQIAKETLHSEEVTKLQVDKLNAEIAHIKTMHKIQEDNEKEIHSLKVQQLRKQIRQDEELHALKLDMFRKKATTRNDVLIY